MSYGLNVTEIPHTEIYIIIDEATVNPTALSEGRVLNIQYDYRYPVLGIPYTQNTAYSMRFGFEKEFVTNTFRYKRDQEIQYYEVCLRKPMYTHF